MSLINEMLKDLEARGQVAARPGAVRAPVTTPKRSATMVLVILATLVLLLGATLAWLLLRPATEMPEAPLATSPVRPEPAQPSPEIIQPITGDSRTTIPQEETTPAASGPAAALPPAASAPVSLAESEPEMPAGTLSSVADDTSSASAQTVEPAPDEAPTMIVKRHEPTAAERALRAGRDGFAALRRGDWLAASRLLNEVVDMEPANDEAREGLAVALSRQGRVAEADGVLLDGLALATNPSRFAKLRARLQLARNDFAGALDSLAIAVPAIAADPEYHALKAAIAQQAGEYKLAAATYARLVEHAPGNGTWQAGLGMALDALNDETQAGIAYRRAVQAGGLEPAILQHIQQRLSALEEK